MDDLPLSPSAHDTSSATPAPSQGSTVPPAAPSGLAKELETGGVASVEVGLRPAAPEVELPREVSAAGVKVQPTTVTLPAPVAKLGVKPGSDAAAPPAAPAVALPLTDDQIAVGLHQSIASSLRWLAEWCLRRLKQLHVGLKTVHGKLMRR